MHCLILAAGRFDEKLKAEIAADREPRLDVFQLGQELAADVLDYLDVERSTHPLVQLTARTAGKSPALALLGYLRRKDYDTFFTTGEDIGLPLSALLKLSPGRYSHTMIAHTLFPPSKQAFFKVGKVGSTFDRILVYSTSEERNLLDFLGVKPAQVQRIYYHADQKFFRPDVGTREAGLICSAGQLLRDYDCLIEAVRGMNVRVQIAAGSPWIDQTLRPTSPLPENVTWGKLNRFELRDLYARAAFTVVPIKQNPYQTGIATILEMMSMGKCVIASRTQGQTDTIVDGVTGIYVPPGDSKALRGAIERVLGNPDEAERIGRAAREFIEKEAGLDVFVERVTSAVRSGHAARFSS
jgi:glycosyltransferase involved in cell wall biosynthesis